MIMMINKWISIDVSISVDISVNGLLWIDQYKWIIMNMDIINEDIQLTIRY